MKIAAHNGAPVWGGAEIALCRLLSGLRRRGHRVVLYYNRSVVGCRARAEFGLDCREAHLGGDLALHHAVRFAQALRRLKPDVLIVGTFRKLFLAAMAGRLAGVPRIVARIGLSTDTPRNLKYTLAFQRWVDSIVVNDTELRASYRSALPTFPPEHLVTVFKGVEAPTRDRSPDAVRREVGVPTDAFVIGTLARLERQKRLDRLISLTARLPREVHCIIVGSGTRRSRLESLAGSLGVGERVHFPGFRDDVGNVLGAMDHLVITSDRESLCNAMLEALAAGVPVVSTPVSGARDALAPLESREFAANPVEEPFRRAAIGDRPGLIVGPDVDAMVEALRSLLEDPERRERMSRAARVRARSRFAPGPMLDAWEDLLAGS